MLGSRMNKTLVVCILAFFAAQSATAGEWIEGRVTHVRDIGTTDVNKLPERFN